MNQKQLNAEYQKHYGHRLKGFTLRMQPELRERLQAQAKKNHRTLTSEINHRLESTLELNC